MNPILAHETAKTQRICVCKASGMAFTKDRREAPKEDRGASDGAASSRSDGSKMMVYSRQKVMVTFAPLSGSSAGVPSQGVR